MTSENVLQAMHETYRADGSGLYTTEVQKSNTTFTIADGNKVKIDFKVPIRPIDESPFAGRSYDVHVNAKEPTNNAPMLIGSDYLKSNRCIVDFDTGVMIYKDDPNIVHHLRTGENGHTLLMPISRDQCEKYYYKTNLTDSHDHVLQATVASLVDAVH